MDDIIQRQSPSSSSSSGASEGNRCRLRRRRYAADEDDEDPAAACTGRSCRSCTAGAIADCVAVCCCPCSVVSFLALAFVRLPWAVARRCIGGRRRRTEEKRKRRELSGSGRGESSGTTSSDIVLSGAVIGDGSNDRFSAEFRAEDVWLELYDEVGHLGFGRVSFTGIPFQEKGN